MRILDSEELLHRARFHKKVGDHFSEKGVTGIAESSNVAARYYRQKALTAPHKERKVKRGFAIAQGAHHRRLGNRSTAIGWKNLAKSY